MRYILHFLIAACLLFFSMLTSSQTFIKKWETDSLLAKPESAIYDEHDEIIYVSNINGEYCAKDSNGFISKVDLAGNISNLKWIEGLNNPQGMGIYNGHLFVADLNRVVDINIRQARIDRIFTVDSAKFFNDIAVDSDGRVYISDCLDNKIYRIENNRIDVWLQDSLLDGPNGLLADESDVYVLNMGNGIIYRVNKEKKSFSLFSEGITNCDGIVADESGGYFVSGAWQGEVFYIDSTGQKSLTIDLGEENKIAADIEFIPGKKLLLIPTLYKTLMAYQFIDT